MTDVPVAKRYPGDSFTKLRVKLHFGTKDKSIKKFTLCLTAKDFSSLYVRTIDGNPLTDDTLFRCTTNDENSRKGKSQRIIPGLFFGWKFSTEENGLNQECSSVLHKRGVQTLRLCPSLSTSVHEFQTVDHS